MIKLKTMVNLNEGSTYRVYMNSDMDRPKEINYEEYFGDGTKEEMIKQARKMTRSNHAKNQYGDPILVKVVHEDDIDDVAWTNESVTEGKGQNLADKYVAKLRSEFRKLNDDELDEFKKTIVQSLDLKESVNEGQDNPVDKKFIRDWEKLCSAMIGRLKIDMRQAPVESRFLFKKNIKRIEDVLDIPTEISYFTENKGL